MEKLNNKDKDNKDKDNKDNKENNKENNKEIKNEVILRMNSILCIVEKYNCDNNKKYKNMINNLSNDFTFLQMYSIFNDMLNDIYITNYIFLHKIIKNYYKEIRDMILYS